LLVVVAFIALAEAQTTASGATTAGVINPFTTVRLANSRLAGRARSGIAAVPLNNYEIFAVGGTISDNTALDDVDRYNAQTNTWRLGTRLNVARNAAGGGNLNGEVYIMGGIDNSLTPLTSMEIFNKGTGIWRFGSSLNFRRWNLGAVTFCTEIYAIGGFDRVTTANVTDFVIRTVNDVEVYSLTTGFWSTTTSLPESRAAFGAVVLNSEIWVLGGTPAFINGVAQTPLISTRIFNITSRNWRPGPDLRQSRVGFGAVVVDNRIFVLGGRTVSGSLISEIEVYDPYNAAAGFQSAGISPRLLRFNNAVSALASDVFLFGGRVSNNNAFSFTNTVEGLRIRTN